jgi:hypothetical protein
MANLLETFHVLVRPTYMSKYPVGQGLILAFGKALFGHPWWGVFLSTGAMCGAAAWALGCWLPLRWALLASLALTLYSVTGYWMNSYWGGSVAALGGSLVLGSAGLLLRHRRTGAQAIHTGLIFGCGCGVLLHTRPWEGSLLAIPLLLALLLEGRHAARGAGVRRALVAAGVPAFAAVVFFLYADWRVTGSPWRPPYQEYRDQYSPAALFIWEHPRHVAPSPHPEFRRFFEDWEPGAFSRQTGSFLEDWAASMKTWFAHVRLLAVALAAGLFIAIRSRKGPHRALLLTLAVFSAGIGLQRYQLLHYVAPALALLVLVVVESARILMLRVRLFRPALYRGALAAVTAIFLLRATLVIAGPENLFAAERDSTERVLTRARGRHLVAVRYAPTHDVHDEWVFNAADVEASKVIWLREPPPSEWRKVVEAFPGRRAWLLEPDRSGRLRPLDASSPAR